MSRNQSVDTPPLPAGNFKDRIGKVFRGFLRQVVPDLATKGTMPVFAGKFTGISFGRRMGRTIYRTFKCYCRNIDHRHGGQFCFKRVIFCLARGRTQTPAVIVNDDFRIIGIFK